MPSMPERRPGSTAEPAREVRWVVRAGDGPTLGDVLRRAGGDATAIREGRVFVGRVRADEEAAPVDEGQVVILAARRDVEDGVRILANEDGVVAAEKRSGIPTIPDQGGSAHSLVALLAKTLGCRVEELHPTSRLDREVSGIVLFARTREAALRLTEARAAGSYFRRYVAIACRAPDPNRGEWSAPIGRDKHPKMRAAFGRHATHATSLYEVIAGADGRALLALEPVTGRTHQLRVHAAHAGAPLLGDQAYGGEPRVVLTSGRVVGLRRIALHAALVVVPRATGGTLEVRSCVPAELKQLWSALGGQDDAWGRAIDGPRLSKGCTGNGLRVEE
jgi:23S rRNA pseudouridine1911/1915/1917 synthase